LALTSTYYYYLQHKAYGYIPALLSLAVSGLLIGLDNKAPGKNFWKRLIIMSIGYGRAMTVKKISRFFMTSNIGLLKSNIKENIVRLKALFPI
jgi:hypothetical protein